MNKFNIGNVVMTEVTIYSKGQCFSIPDGLKCVILKIKEIKGKIKYLINRIEEELVITFWCSDNDIKAI